jgi:predicted metalloprotease with PDZ domain
MKTFSHPLFIRFFATVVTLLAANLTFAQVSSPAIVLKVDVRDAPRKILHARLTIPAAPGPLTLHYPKWIPGEHAPTGPITDLVGLKVTAAQKPLPWQRDLADMFAFHVNVPAEANAVEVTLDFLLPTSAEGFSSAASASAQLAVISWNQLLLYPKGARSDELKYQASVQLPAGWKFGTALPVASQTSGAVEFAPVSLTTLVDSPLVTGNHFRTLELTPGGAAAHRIHLAADSAAALEMTPEQTAAYKQLIAETGALFGARHYRNYSFLFTLSDHVAHFGLEHHESSDNRLPERTLIDDDLRKLGAGLLPHEMVHSWNGKYRRPADLTTPDFHQPMKSDLLWVYEGLTTYLGEVLTVRSGLWTNSVYHEMLALITAELDQKAGRTWRPLVDTATAAQLLYTASPEGAAWRRGVDFYPEGLLIWLEADTLIRQQSQGRRSLDDFCRRFFGGESGPPAVTTYTFDDIVAALNEIQPQDWHGFFHTRVNATNPRAPMGGIEGGGWRLIYNETIPDLLKAGESADKFTDVRYSIGLLLKEDGVIKDVIPGLAAEKAGVGPGMKLLAVNGRRWSPTLLREAVKATKTGAAPLELLLENGEFIKTHQLDYQGGERYPHLERDPAKLDLLGPILKPLVANPASNSAK